MCGRRRSPADWRREANQAKQTNTALGQPEAQIQSDDVVLYQQLGLGPKLSNNLVGISEIRFKYLGSAWLVCFAFCTRL
jgi:hypothetical protein